MSQLDAELREFIRRLNLQDDRIALAGQRAAALAEGIRDFVADGRGGGGVSLTTLNGQIVGGLGPTLVPMPDTTLRIVGHVSGFDYGTYLVPTGTYNITLANVDPSDTSMDFYPTGPVSPRFAGALPKAYNRTVIRGVTNNILGVIPPAAPGYGYLIYSFVGSAGACQYPVGPLAYTDSLLGTGFVNWASSPDGIDALGTWGPSDCFLANYKGFGSCVARTGVPVRLYLTAYLTGGVQPAISYQMGGFSTCPTPGTCPITVSSPVSAVASPTPVSKICPAVDLSTKFDATWNTTSLFHNSSPNTMRFYEP